MKIPAAFSPTSKILVVDLAFIGDLLMSTPAYTALRKRFPSARIDLLVSPGSEPVTRNNGDIDQVLTTSMKKEGWAALKDLASRISKKGYDAAISLHRGHGTLLMLKESGIPIRIGFTNGGRGMLLTHGIPFELYRHRAWNHLRLLEKSLGISVDYATPSKMIPNEEAALSVNAKLGEIDDLSKLVAVNPNAAWSTKRWLPERFAELIDRLNEMGLITVIVGSEKEKVVSDKILSMVKTHPIDLTGKTSLQELAGLLSLAKLVITNDSGPMHIAQAVGTPVVSIFGPTDPARCGPWLGKIEPIQAKIDCIKCYRKHCWHMTCMREIETGRIISKIQKV